jgi:hypothetical protein
MSDIFFGNSATWFTVPALVGTLFFLARLGLMLVGGGDWDVDADVDADVDGDFDDSDHAFKVLSIQSITAFMMGFGWGGLGGLKGAGWSIVNSVAFGVVAGVGMVWMLAKLMQGIYHLQSSGNVPIESTLDAEGSVYVAIPPHGEGKGQVRLIVGNHERFYQAVTDDLEALESRERIRVIGVNDDNSLNVTRA